MDLDINALQSTGFLQSWETYSLLFGALTVLVFIPMKLYNSLWVFASAEELMRIILAVFIVALVELVVVSAGWIPLPRSFPVIHAPFLVCFSAMPRFSYRILRGLRHANSGTAKKRTMLVGAGSAGMLILRELQQSSGSHNNVVCLVDDDRSKIGQYIRNVKIAGTRENIIALAKQYSVEEVIFAIPSAIPQTQRDILQICQETGCKVKIIPGVSQLANEEVSIQKIREVDVLDLLGRDTVKVNMEQISAYLEGKTILVTGGGGSIGSELCRQIAEKKPARLIIFDIYENNAYAIQQELMRRHPELNLVTLIGSVRDAHRVDTLFAQYQPEIIFHAAAHKHVPLMEDSPNEAIKNNVFGTLHVAQAADRHGANAFVLISTDKAVNPTNIMGASKRICEMIVQMMANRSKTKFVAVRFGNVLGSNGSVIPLFKKQIQEGGPVTVTHPDIVRYFMTIPEAVSLVLQAGAYANRGEIFVLDMGSPVRIADLAKNLIRLSGFEPDVDIAIKYTGLRPGEKLYEEMLMEEEGLRETENHLIHIGKPLDVDEAAVLHKLERLEGICYDNSPQIFETVAEIVPTYHVKVNA